MESCDGCFCGRRQCTCREGRAFFKGCPLLPLFDGILRFLGVPGVVPYGSRRMLCKFSWGEGESFFQRMPTTAFVLSVNCVATSPKGGGFLLPCLRFTVKTKTDRVFGLFRYFCGLLKLREKLSYLCYFSASKRTLGAFALYTSGACVFKE